MRPANFRDVGEALELWRSPSPIAPGRLLRGGRIDTLTTVDDLDSPKTILNLRRGPDPAHLALRLLHVPTPDDVENYDTRLRRVASWVRASLEVLTRADVEWPVYVHCTSGRDRTGVVVAALLLAVDVPPELIVEEYLLSDGAKAELFAKALDGLCASPVCDEGQRARLRACLAP